MSRIKKKQLLNLGFPKGGAINKALIAMRHEAYVKRSRDEKLHLLTTLIRDPEQFYKHEILGETARQIKPEEANLNAPLFPSLLEDARPYRIFGKRDIEDGALDQMEVAARLPIAVAGALMPDAHQGYGLPIGGVLATENAIIPYAVGVDTGCRMCLSGCDVKAEYMKKHRGNLEQLLLENSVFGAGQGFAKPRDHAVLQRSEFSDIKVVRDLKDKAWKQIGSSGGGNHFVEFGEISLKQADKDWNLPPGNYLAILTHSGSRGLGATIAGHYTRLAMDKNRLPKETKHLAWLDLNDEAGQEYWLAMNLAGDYASACHHQIHDRLSEALGETPAVRIENHHNFAWKEQHMGRELIVHRKGATPAGEGVLGIIPGSMTLPGFVVRGKGHEGSLHSASHGAGRLMSRRKAKNSFTRHGLKKTLREHGVSLIGGGLDEAPGAYKDIHQVMAAQRQLVDIIAQFQPRIVRMADD
ncbi:MAG: RtcB family protein [Bacteroidia bacterium]